MIPPEPPANTPIAWQTQIGDRLYTYVAIRVPGSGWFHTGTSDGPLSWTDLCRHLGPGAVFLELAPTGRYYYTAHH